MATLARVHQNTLSRLWNKLLPQCYPATILATKTRHFLNPRTLATSSLNHRRVITPWRSTDMITYPLHLRATTFMHNTAFVDSDGSYTYGDLIQLACKAVDRILQQLGTSHSQIHKLKGKRVAVLCPNDRSYVVSQWAVWMLDGVMVPLAMSHPPSEWEYFIQDSGSSLIITTDEFYNKINSVAKKLSIELFKLTEHDLSNNNFELKLELNMPYKLPDHSWNRMKQQRKQAIKQKYAAQNALIIYTSGTTGKPKGVVHTFGSLHSQITDMRKSWQWKASDVVLHVLPLHHVHGLVNVLMTPLYCGATCVMLPKFDPGQVWSSLTGSVVPGLTRAINMFHAVPQIYQRLIDYHEIHFNTERQKNTIRMTCLSNIRLMVSGSSALQETTMKTWQEITGHQLLERYGMTELGMVLNNPLEGTRVPGSVGNPFASVKVKIVEESNGRFIHNCYGTASQTKVVEGRENKHGILYVKSSSMFKEYWNRPEATKNSFTTNGWFITGDTAVYQNGVYYIKGRPIDIIKSKSYKISALDIEARFKEHNDIEEVQVFGLPSSGDEQIVAVLVMRSKFNRPSEEELKSWAAERMPKYSVPQVFVVLEDIPRNAMSKINKSELRKQLFPDIMAKYQ